MKQIEIDPCPSSKAFSSTSVDLTLGDQLQVFKKAQAGMETVIDPSADGYNYLDAIQDLVEKKTISEEGFALQPNILLLAWTIEKIKLPVFARVAARVEGKSSLARLGLGVHITAPTIQAGFTGNIQLEVVNHGARPIKLRKGMPICQLIFEQTLGVADKGYKGQFLGQSS